MNEHQQRQEEASSDAPSIREQLEAIMAQPIRSRMSGETVKHCGSIYDVTPPSFHFVDGQKSAKANPHMSRITRGKDGLSTDVRGWLRKIPNRGGETFRFTPAEVDDATAHYKNVPFRLRSKATAEDIGANLNERRSRAMKMGIACGLI